MRNDIFITPSLPLLIAEGKQAALDPWIYECMFMVQQERLKPLGLSPDVMSQRINEGFQKNGIRPLNSMSVRNNLNSKPHSGPLGRFFK